MHAPEQCQHALLNRMPTDPRDWWTGEEVDEFLEQWEACGLTLPVLGDASGEVLTLWVTDVHAVAEEINKDITEHDDCFTLTRGEYQVCVMQADTKETKHA